MRRKVKASRTTKKNGLFANFGTRQKAQISMLPSVKAFIRSNLSLHLRYSLIKFNASGNGVFKIVPKGFIMQSGKKGTFFQRIL